MSRRLALATTAALLLGAPVLPHAAAVDDPNDAYPKTGCVNYTDPTGDGQIGSHYGVPGSAVAPNDADLDITGVALHATPIALKVFVRANKLATKPTVGPGHVWAAAFTTLGKTISVSETTVSGAPQLSAKSVKVNGAANSTIKLDAIEDTAKSFVVFTIDKATFEAAVPGGLAPGTPLVGVNASSATYYPTGYDTADLISAPTGDDYAVGDDAACFPPPPSVLTNAGAVKAQFTDAAAVAAKLTTEAGTALAGKAVKFTIGGRSVTATTDADGVAKALLDPATPAGTYSLVTSFAGDGSAAKVDLTTPFTVTTEVTKLTLKVVKSGTKRTVTATLRDDDGKPVAGQVVAWYVNGKKVSSPKTTAAGTVTLTAQAAQTVVAQFNAVAGKYAASKVTQKV
jgi:hypothetical protein